MMIFIDAEKKALGKIYQTFMIKKNRNRKIK